MKLMEVFLGIVGLLTIIILVLGGVALSLLWPTIFFSSPIIILPLSMVSISLWIAICMKLLERAILNRPSSDDPNAGMGGGQYGRIMALQYQAALTKKKEEK